MALTINLPGGRSIALDENTGNILGETSAAVDGSGGTANKDDWYNDPKRPLPPTPGGGGADEFDPATDRVTDVVGLPGGKQVSYIGKDGKLKTTFVSDGKGSGGVSATTAYTQQQANERDAAGLAENKRQFDEMFGFNKAKYNQDYELERGKTLLQYGSRPDTLTRYLYAIRGQQTPQALGGQTVPLPGFQNIFANPGSSSPAAPAAPGMPTPAAPTAPAMPTPAIPAGAQPLKAGGYTPKVGTADPNMSGGRLLSAQERQRLSVPRPNVAPGQTPKALGPNRMLIYGEGGVIPEPVVGQGMTSGQSYMFGEKGPETVVPATEDYSGNPQPDLMEIVKMFMEKGKSGHAAFGKQLAMMLSEKQGAQNSYASGGTIGYNPELFNPSGLSNIVNRGYNSTPDVPLLPSVGLATGGTSFIPSAQRLNNMLPSEQSSYAGSLQDEFGLQPDDVFSLAQKLAPKARGLSTPRYS